MDGFIGRQRELRSLDRMLEEVRSGGRIGRPGKALLVRGRRRVGKSRLIAEFLHRSEIPHLFYTAVGGSKADDLSAFVVELSRSTLLGADRFGRYRTPTSWDEALTLLADNLPNDTVTAIVLDEMPYLVREDPSFEGSLQKAFDRYLSSLPVMLILVGSDIAMMEQINTYGRPFYQRGTEMVVPPLNPADVAELTGLDAADAFDAYLISGGLPLILEAWPNGADIWEYLEDALHNPISALLVNGERALAAEFPTEAQARQVLSAIGHGERSFTLIGRAAGDLQPTSLKRSLGLLTERGIVAAELPVSMKPSRLVRYRVDDPYLRFWLSFIGPNIAMVERAGGSRVLETVRNAWTTWRGRAIEPVVREALWRMAYDRVPDGTDVVGGYWTRTNDPEIDLVGADRGPVAKRITFVGSIKWHENKPFDDRELARLIVHRSQLPGADESTPLLAVARAGCTAKGVEAFSPEDLIAAWRLGPDSAPSVASTTTTALPRIRKVPAAQARDLALRISESPSMDNETPEPPRIDPPVGVSQITVEAAPVAAEANWSPGRASARRTAVPGRPCPHRVRFRDLKASRKGLFASVASLAFGALALALLGLFAAIGLAIVAVVDPDPTALIAAAVVAVPSALLVIGIVACSRTWRRLHRPGLPVCVLTTIALLPITVGVAYAAATGSLWAAILMVPPLVPVVVLWYFRSALYDRATCARYPWFPPQVVAMLQLDPGPATEYARAKAGAFRIEDCPHVVRFRDLRTRHRIYGLGFSFLYFLYLLGFFAMCIVVLAIMVGSFHTGPAATAATAAGAAVFIPLTAVGLNEYSARAKRLHRAVTGVYTLAFIGFVGFAGLAVWVAVILDDPLFYGIAALTVVPVLSARSAAKTLTKRSECRTHPELPPEIQALMKG